MSVKLLYRITTDADLLTSNTIKQYPLEMKEIDGNFVAISTEFDNIDKKFDDFNIRINEKADIDNPKFTGSITIPVISNGAYPPSPIDGTLVYNVSERKLFIYTAGDFKSLNDILGQGSYVKRDGDVMNGKLVVPSLEVQSPIVAMNPDGNTEKPFEVVATVGWTTDTINGIINERIGDVGERNDIDIGGNIYCERVYGDMDLGTL